MKLKTLVKQITVLFFLTVLPVWAIGQTITVRGTVTDDQGGTLLGVSVKEVGTTNGASTNNDGKYELRVNGNASLLFSYIGYKNQTVQVNNRSVINIVLQQDVLGLDEIVVVGYGTQRKEAVTGSVVSIRGDIMR